MTQRMKKLVIYYLLLVTALAARRLESTTESCRATDDIPNSAKSEADSQVQKWTSLQNIWYSIYTTAHKTFEKYVVNPTAEAFNFFSEKTKSWYNTTAEFTEALRTVFREEIFQFFVTFIPKFVNDPSFDIHQFWYHLIDYLILNTLWSWIHVIGLIIICLILSYIFWHLYLGILFILTFNCTIIILYGVLGAQWVYWLFWTGVQFVWYCYAFMRSHPKMSGVVMVAIFIWRLKSWYQRIGRGKRIEAGIASISIRLLKIEEQQEEIKTQLQKIEEQQEEIKTQLQKIEEQQEEMINTRLQKIEEQQEEVLNLLRELQSANTSQ